MKKDNIIVSPEAVLVALTCQELSSGKGSDRCAAIIQRAINSAVKLATADLEAKFAAFEHRELVTHRCQSCRFYAPGNSGCGISHSRPDFGCVQFEDKPASAIGRFPVENPATGLSWEHQFAADHN